MTGELVPENLVGHRVLDTEGQNVGKIKQVFLDDQTGEPSWVSVHTGLFGMKETLVPLQGAQPMEEDIQIPYDKATVKDAPQVDADRHVSPEDEELVRDYFARHGGFPQQAQGESDRSGGTSGTAGTAAGTAAATPMSTGTGDHGNFADQREGRGDEPETAGADASGQYWSDERLGGSGGPDGNDQSFIRHEEQVDIGVERRESGQARMRRHVETERFDETVPLHHEELEVERRPITDPSQVRDTGHMEEGEETFTLYEERAVVSKEEVPVEEIHVRKRDVTNEEHVQGELRKEKFDFEDGSEEPPSP